MGRLFMRHRVSWLILVVSVAMVVTWLTSPIASRAQDGGTDLAATPCKITAQPRTIGDPEIRFRATVTFGRRYAKTIPHTTAETTAEFIALPSHKPMKSVKSIHLTGSFSVDFHVPDGTREIGVRLTTGNHVDRTYPRTDDNLGRYKIDAPRKTTRTWYIRYAPRGGSEPKPTPTSQY